MLPLFYAPDIQQPDYELNETESVHAIRVLRLGTGDRVNLVDGKGSCYEAMITEAHPKHCVLDIRASHTIPSGRNQYLHLAVAPPKNTDRFEWFLEKATEIGIEEITPVICEHSERRNLKLDRMRKILIAAMKQSMQARLPRLNEPVLLSRLIRAPFTGRKYVAHCADQERKELNKEIASCRSNLILIGPEGDFSRTEIELALQQQFVPVSLGNNRLRTETAAIVACHTAALILNTTDP
ncbi:MAG: 16S rRNA (uracil(1498)-N(3))-methyltransferase [Mangrovibacterium sp.]